jgi:hypothetical protein
MRVAHLVDEIPAKVRNLSDDYWRFSGELDDLEMAHHLMIAPVATQVDALTDGERVQAADGENAREK